MIGVLGTPVLACVATLITWSLFRREGRLILLPEGILPPGLGAPVLIPWREINSVEFVEVQSGNRRNPSLSIRVCFPQFLRISAVARWCLFSVNDPNLFSVSLVGYTRPEIVAAVMRHYVEGEGKTATIGTTWGLRLLEAALNLGEAGEPPARVHQTQVPYLDIPWHAVTFPHVAGEVRSGWCCAPQGCAMNSLNRIASRGCTLRPLSYTKKMGSRACTCVR